MFNVEKNMIKYIGPGNYDNLFVYLAFVSVAISGILNKLFVYLESYIGKDIPIVIRSILVYGILFWIVDKHLWRMKFVNRILGIPDLNGTWKGELNSEHPDANNPYFQELKIKQTFTRMCISSETEESTSTSYLIKLEKKDEHYTLTYAYLNTPKENAKTTMSMHNGLNHLRYKLDSDVLNGPYITDRKPFTRGTMSLNRE